MLEIPISVCKTPKLSNEIENWILEFGTSNLVFEAIKSVLVFHKIDLSCFTCKSVTGCRVLDPPTLLQEQGTEPPILSLIILNVVQGPHRLGRVLGHDVGGHQGTATEQAETA